MLATTLLASLLWGTPQPPQPIDRPAIQIRVVGRDLLYVVSSHPIEETYLSPHERYSCFVEYSPDCRQAAVLLRTTRDPIRLHIETAIPGTGLRHKHALTVRNPGLCR